MTKVYKQTDCGRYEFVGFDLSTKDSYNSVIITTPNGCIISINKDNINDFIITDDDVSKVVEILKKEIIVKNDNKGSIREGDSKN